MATNTAAVTRSSAGGYPVTGAARLAARAAARAGSGLTTIAVPEIALPIYAAALTSIMIAPLASTADFAALLADPRITAFLIGPGAGVGEQTRARTLAMLATPSRDRDRRGCDHFVQGAPIGARARDLGSVRADAARGRIRTPVRCRRRQAHARARGSAAQRRGHRLERPRYRDRRTRRPGDHQCQCTAQFGDRGIRRCARRYRARLLAQGMEPFLPPRLPFGCTARLRRCSAPVCWPRICRSCCRGYCAIYDIGPSRMITAP
jgi:hypothetical protein